MCGATLVLQLPEGCTNLLTPSLDTVSLGERIVKKPSREYTQNNKKKNTAVSLFINVLPREVFLTHLFRDLEVFIHKIFAVLIFFQQHGGGSEGAVYQRRLQDHRGIPH